MTPPRRAMETLVDLIREIERLDEREAVRFHNGFRTWTLSYRSLYRRIAGFVDFLDREELGKGDRLLLWGENRPEWVVAFWASVARGIEVVPIDFHSSARLVGRIQKRIHARWLVHGFQVDSEPLEPRLQMVSFERIARMEADGFEPAAVVRDDIVQIVFTSGTTGDPKGVVHRHRHLSANLTPIQREIDRYKKLARPFQPIRILDLLPLSHLYGQSLGLFIPVLLGGAAVFMRELQPGAVIRTVRRERVSVLVGVPQLLSNLRHEVERKSPTTRATGAAKGLTGALKSWWTHRDIHRSFGWKFWALVVGGAQLPLEEESFWRRLGFVVVQGYGLTETSPAITTNHPFHPTPGSLGQIVGDLQIRIAPDGEILVRGESVVSEFVGGSPASTTFVDSEGWLHTGDLGRLDEANQLYFLGRKKDLIVTADGLNVYPQDVEAALNQLLAVRESVVLAVPRGGKDEVHAVLLLSDPGADIERLVGQTNENLEPHQRIRGWTLWPDEDFPRTASTMKIKRQEILDRLKGSRAQINPSPGASTGVTDILAEMTGRGASELRDDLRINEDLGLSSLEQVDLLSRLEEHYRLPLDETSLSLSETVGELKNRLGAPQPRPEAKPKELVLETLPRWSRSFPVRWTRTVIQQTLFWPLLHRYIELTVEGVENLATIEPPAIFAANHESHLDTPFIIAALPFRWRRWIAPAAQEEHFHAFLQPSRSKWAERVGVGFQYLLACGLFNIYVLPRDVTGVRRALRYTGELVQKGFCPLIFPEGERTPDGKMMTFQPGIGLMAVRLGVPIIPIHLRGMYEIFSMHDRWPRTGAVRIRIGKPLRLGETEDYRAATEKLRAKIAAMSGAEP